MLRTQEAALYAIGAAGIGQLCEAICLDAIEVARAQRVSIWFFSDRGDMVCQRMVDAADGRIQQGAVIPRDATEAYLEAAGSGLQATVTDKAPMLHGGSDADEPNRLDLLLIDGVNQPAAVFRCERRAGSADWSERDLRLLRSMAQTLAASIRREGERYDQPSPSPAPSPKQIGAPRRSVINPPMGMMPQNLARLGLDRTGRMSASAIRLPQPPAGEPDGDDSGTDLAPHHFRDDGEF